MISVAVTFLPCLIHTPTGTHSFHQIDNNSEKVRFDIILDILMLQSIIGLFRTGLGKRNDSSSRSNAHTHCLLCSVLHGVIRWLREAGKLSHCQIDTYIFSLPNCAQRWQFSAAIREASELLICANAIKNQPMLMLNAVKHQRDRSMLYKETP